MSTYHCKLIIEGPQKLQIAAVRLIVRKRVDNGSFVIDFDRIVPEPEGLSDKDALAWRLEHWGVSHLGRVVSFAEYNEKYNIKFEVEDAPPTPAMLALVRILSDQRFTFFFERERDRKGDYGMFRADKGRVTKTKGNV